MGYAWGWLFWLLLIGACLWAAFAWWPGRRSTGWYSADWNGYGYRYGPTYGNPPGRRVSPNRGRGPRGYKRSDQRIAEDINDRLTVDDDVDPSDVEVAVREGHVELAGAVHNRAERRMVEAIADSVPGVVDVENHLRIGMVSSTEIHPT